MKLGRGLRGKVLNILASPQLNFINQLFSPTIYRAVCIFYQFYTGLWPISFVLLKEVATAGNWISYNTFKSSPIQKINIANALEFYRGY